MLGRIQAWLAALGVALAAIGAAWLRGRSQGKADARARQDQAYRETTERIHDATEANRDLSDDDVDRKLRDHASRQWRNMQ